MYEAASYGLPIVATELLQTQLGWTEGEDMLSAPVSDPARFAAQIVRLYRDEALWERIRSGALARIEAENGAERYARCVWAILNRSAAPAKVIPFSRRALGRLCEGRSGGRASGREADRSQGDSSRRAQVQMG